MKTILRLLLLLSQALFASADGKSFQNLPRCSAEQQGISSEAILAFVEAADAQVNTMNSFILIRHDCVVAEGWWVPYDAQSPHMLFSLSKSFTSTAVGLAIEEGKITLDDEVLKFFPEDVPTDATANLKAMRVRDLLCMSTGHQTEPTLTMNERWTKTFLSHPVPFKPGTHFLYNTPASYMLSAIVQKVTGTTVLDYLGPRLFDLVGIKNPTWDMSPQGISLGGYGLSVRTEDIARFGLLYLQKGKWQGRQVVPESWVNSATSRQTSNGSDPKSDWDQGYGYQFWRCRHGAFRGDGAFGQFCVVMPEQDVVVAITSGDRKMQATLDLVWEKLLPAMKAAPLPPNAAAQEKLSARLRAPAVRPPSGRANSPLGAMVSKKTYMFPTNDRHIVSMGLDVGAKDTTLFIRTDRGEDSISCGEGAWRRGRSKFVNGLDSRMVRAAEHPIAAAGSWTADDTYTVKLCLYETPFYTTLCLRFEGEQLFVDAEHNVAFGPTTLPQLVGRMSSSQ